MNYSPKAIRFDKKRFRTKDDWKLYEFACDQIDAGKDCDFYLQKMNTGFVKMPDGSSQRYYFR